MGNAAPVSFLGKSCCWIAPLSATLIYTNPQKSEVELANKRLHLLTDFFQFRVLLYREVKME